jgi:hypothetical protein
MVALCAGYDSQWVRCRTVETTDRKGKLMPTKSQQTFFEADKAAWRAAKQQRMTDLGEQLKAQVARVQDSDAFKRYLIAQAVFHRYSARNVFLILYQMPDATRVACYTAWQKLGRQVAVVRPASPSSRLLRSSRRLRTLPPAR